MLKVTLLFIAFHLVNFLMHAKGHITKLHVSPICELTIKPQTNSYPPLSLPAEEFPTPNKEKEEKEVDEKDTENKNHFSKHFLTCFHAYSYYHLINLTKRELFSLFFYKALIYSISIHILHCCNRN